MDIIHVTADADALCRRASMLIDSGRLDAARPLLAAARALAPPSSELTLAGARLALGSGNWDHALRELDTAIAEAPVHAGLRKCRADVRQRMGDFEGAARDAAEAVIADPGDAHAMAILGATMLDLGRVIDGIVCLSEAVARVPASLQFRQALARTLESAGETDSALRVLAEGIALTPASVALRNTAIMLCMRRRDYRQAVRLAEQACSAGVADATTFGIKGHGLSSLGRHEEAALAYQDALKLGPEDPHVRHLVMASGLHPDAKRAPESFVRTAFDGYADRFESHLLSLGYAVPGAIRSILMNHPKIAVGQSVCPVLDLGCGTGLVALAVGDLPLTALTGVDLSPRMLAHAKAKCIYADLQEADIIAYLATHDAHWPLIIAGDVTCYFGEVEELLGLVHKRLEPGGWFVFSVEKMLADHDGIMPGNGAWALQRQGRYVHAEHYIYEAVCDAGFRILRMDRPVIRQEAGADVPGLLLAVERIRHDC